MVSNNVKYVLYFIGGAIIGAYLHITVYSQHQMNKNLDKYINEAKVIEVINIKEVEIKEVVPDKFTIFRADFEIITKKPENADYATKQTNGLKSLLATVPSVKSVTINKLETGIIVDGKKKYFEVK